MLMNHSKNRKWDIPFKNSPGRLRINNSTASHGFTHSIKYKKKTYKDNLVLTDKNVAKTSFFIIFISFIKYRYCLGKYNVNPYHAEFLK